MQKIVQIEDFRGFPMPKETDTFYIKRILTEEQMTALKRGHVSRQMEDKWNWYCEADTLYAHRSWTGYCMYIIEFNTSTWIHKVTVNRFEEQYRCKDVQEDAIRLHKLLDWWSQPTYDFYHQWLSETLDNISRQQK